MCSTQHRKYLMHCANTRRKQRQVNRGHRKSHRDSLETSPCGLRSAYKWEASTSESSDGNISAFINIYINMLTMIAPGTLQPSPQHYLTSSQLSYLIISYAHSRTWTLLVVKTLHQPKSCQTPRTRHQRGSAQHHQPRYIGKYQHWQYTQQNVVEFVSHSVISHI